MGPVAQAMGALIDPETDQNFNAELIAWKKRNQLFAGAAWVVLIASSWLNQSLWFLANSHLMCDVCISVSAQFSTALFLDVSSELDFSSS